MTKTHIQWAARTGIALAVIMAIGCGDSSGKNGQRAHIKRSLQTKLLNQNAKDQKGNVNYTSKDGGASMAPTDLSNVEQAFSAVAASGSQLKGVDQLDDGAYTLKSVTTEYKLIDASTGETVASMSASNMNNDQLVQTNSLNNNAKLTSADSGRSLIAPYKFNKQGTTVAAEQSLTITSKVGADARTTDTVNAADGVDALSLLNITNSGLQALSQKNLGDFGYKAADKNVPVFVRVSRVGDSEVQFILEFDEAGFSADGTPLNQQKAITRHMVLTYGFAKPQSLPDASKKPTQQETPTESTKADDGANAAAEAAAAADLGLPSAGDEP